MDILHQVVLAADKHHLVGCDLVKPSTDDSPAPRENCGRVEDKTDTEPFRVMLAKQPDEVFDKRVVHAVEAKILKVKDDAKVVYNFLEAFLTCLLQDEDDEPSQFVYVPLLDIMLAGRDIDDRPAIEVPVGKNHGLLGFNVSFDIWVTDTDFLNTIFCAPLVTLENCLESCVNCSKGSQEPPDGVVVVILLWVSVEYHFQSFLEFFEILLRYL